MAAGAEKTVTLAAKEAVWKLGFEHVKACQLDVIAGVVSGRDVFVILPIYRRVLKLLPAVSLLGFVCSNYFP